MKPVEAYILKQPEHIQTMMLHVCVVIEQVIPEAELLFKWNVPFYYYKKKPFCYLNPNKKHNCLDVNFFYGFKLEKYKSILIHENRKMIASLRYFSLESIDTILLVCLLNEAKDLY